MEELKRMIIKSIRNDNFYDDKIKQGLLKFPPLEFISYFLVDDGDIDLSSLFFQYYQWYWEKLDYDEWKELLVRVSNSAPGIFSFFEISYGDLKIDMIPLYIGLKNVNNYMRYHALKRFFKIPHILQHDNKAERVTEMRSLDKECLPRMRKKLLSQGAIEAQRVEPRKKLQVGYTRVEPPSSWHVWVRDLSLDENDKPPWEQ